MLDYNTAHIILWRVLVCIGLVLAPTRRSYWPHVWTHGGPSSGEPLNGLRFQFLIFVELLHTVLILCESSLAEQLVDSGRL